jgi:hypothetical protein
VTWFKVDDSFWGHPKRMACTPAALGLWVTAGSWAGQQLTDGTVPAHVLATLGGKPKDAQILVNAGLWHAAGHDCPKCPAIANGYLFHDWQQWQPTRAKVHEHRDAEARRKQEWRDKRRAQREADAAVPPGHDPDDPGTGPSQGRGTDADVLSTRPDPTRPDPTRPERSKNSRAARQERATAIPDDFALDDLLLAAASKHRMPATVAQREFEAFTAHHGAKGTTFVDWRKAWTTWVLHWANRNRPVAAGEDRPEWFS